MVTNDEKISSIVEIGVQPPHRRIEAIRMLSQMGYWTILRLRPYIIGVTDESIDSLLEDALDAGINAISMEFYALDARAQGEAQKRYDWLERLFSLLAELQKRQCVLFL